MSEAETRRDGAVATYRKGAWSKEEDEKLKRAVEELGDKNWVRIERFSGLARPAKNCRLRWFNYLRPNLKKYPFTKHEEDFIFHLHAQYGNAWSRIASKLPGRSDNDIKNLWHKKAKKRQREELRICPTPKHKKESMISTPESQSMLVFSPEPTSSASPLFQMHFNSPYKPPFSPLNSMPAPSQSSFPIQDSILTFPSCTLPPTQPITPVQGQLPQTLGVNSYMHQLEPHSNLELINELRKAQARVRFLKQKLRQRGISNKRDLFKPTSRNPEDTHLLTTQVPFDENSSRMKEVTQKNMVRTKEGIEDLKVERVQEREKSESGDCIQEIIHSEMSTHGEYSDSKASLQKCFGREEEEDLIDEIFKIKNSETFPEQRHHSYHINSQCNMITSNWKLWNECSSSLLQELEEDLFGERSQIDEPFSPKGHRDAVGAVYSQSSATTLDKPGDGSGQLSYGAEYFQRSLEQELSDGLDIRFPDSNLGAESLPAHQNTAVDLVSQPMAVHESLGCHDFSLQTCGKHSAPTQLCQSSYIQNQYHEAQQCSLDGLYGGMTERTMGEETWKQELVEGLVADNLWVEDENLCLDRYDFTC